MLLLVLGGHRWTPDSREVVPFHPAPSSRHARTYLVRNTYLLYVRTVQYVFWLSQDLLPPLVQIDSTVPQYKSMPIVRTYGPSTKTKTEKAQRGQIWRVWYSIGSIGLGSC